MADTIHWESLVITKVMLPTCPQSGGRSGGLAGKNNEGVEEFVSSVSGCRNGGDGLSIPGC